MIGCVAWWGSSAIPFQAYAPRHPKFSRNWPRGKRNKREKKGLGDWSLTRGILSLDFGANPSSSANQTAQSVSFNGVQLAPKTPRPSKTTLFSTLIRAWTSFCLLFSSPPTPRVRPSRLPTHVSGIKAVGTRSNHCSGLSCLPLICVSFVTTQSSCHPSLRCSALRHENSQLMGEWGAY